MHDATWRSNFGGDIYLTNGSHDGIGEVTLEKENQISNMWVAYHELSSDAKEQVTNFEKLLAAKQKLDDQKAAGEE